MLVTPSARVQPFVSSMFSMTFQTRSKKFPCTPSMPKSLESWLERDIERRAGGEPLEHRLRDEVDDESQLEQTGDDGDHARRHRR